MASFQREDGRSENQVRQVATEFGMLERADGSARFSLGDTCVIAGVHGPVEPKRANDEQMDRATVIVALNPETGVAGQAESDMERVIRGVVESAIQVKLYPRMVVSVIIQVVSNDGSLLSTALNATTLALADAGVAMNYFPISITAALSRVQLSNGEKAFIVDTTLQEEAKCAANMTMTFNNSSHDSFSASVMEGLLTPTQLKTAVSSGSVAANLIRSFVTIALKRQVEQRMKLAENSRTPAQLMEKQPQEQEGSEPGDAEQVDEDMRMASNIDER